MAKGRMLNQSVADDDRLNSLSMDAMLLYLMCLPHLDRDGLIDGRPRILSARVAPLRDDLGQRAANIIDEWVEIGLVERYTGERTPILWFRGFQKNQEGMLYNREKASAYPPPPGYYRDRNGLAPLVGSEEAAAQAVDDETPVEVPVTQPGHRTAAPSARQGHVKVATNARPCHAEDQDQSEVEVEDQHGDDGALTAPTTSVMADRGEVQEGGAHSPAAAGAGSAGELLATFTDDQLRQAAYQLGSLINLHVEWTNWPGWLARQSPGTVVHILEWIHFYRAMPENVIDRIDSLPAVIRHNLKDKARAPLTTPQRRQLATDIQNALYVVQEA